MTDLWRTHQTIGLCMLTATFLVLFWRRYGMPATCLIGHAMISAILVFQVPAERYPTFQLLADSKTAIGLANLLLIVAAVGFCRISTERYLFVALETLVALNSLVAIFLGHGIFNAGSFDATVAALVIPALLWRPDGGRIYPRVRPYLAFICAAFILKAQGTTAFVVLAVSAAGWLLTSSRGWDLGLLHKIGIVAYPALLVLAGWVVTGRDFFQPWSRTTEWPRFLEWFWSNANVWTGTGLGTFEVIGPQIQREAGLKSGLFLFMHNDWLQILFELGALGLVLALIVAAQAYWRVRNTPWAVSLLCGIGVAMLTQFPLRFTASAVWVALVLRVCLGASRTDVFSERHCPNHEKPRFWTNSHIPVKCPICKAVV